MSCQPIFRLLLPAMLAGVLMPAFALAEGSVRVLSCEVQRQCDADGLCAAHAEAIEFRMEPLQLDSDGAGEFTLQTDDRQKISMRALSDIGPFVWQHQLQRYTLLASSDTRFMLHMLTLAEQPSATVQFMQCVFSQ